MASKKTKTKKMGRAQSFADTLDKIIKKQEREMTKCLQMRVDDFKKSVIPREEGLLDLLDDFEHQTWSVSLHAAYWYLRGAAEMANMTMSEMLDAYEVDLT